MESQYCLHWEWLGYGWAFSHGSGLGDQQNAAHSYCCIFRAIAAYASAERQLLAWGQPRLNQQSSIWGSSLGLRQPMNSPGPLKSGWQAEGWLATREKAAFSAAPDGVLPMDCEGQS